MTAIAANKNNKKEQRESRKKDNNPETLNPPNVWDIPK